MRGMPLRRTFAAGQATGFLAKCAAGERADVVMFLTAQVHICSYTAIDHHIEDGYPCQILSDTPF